MLDPRRTRFAVRATAVAALSLVAVACGGGGGGGGDDGGSAFPEAQDLASVTPSPTTAAVQSGAGDFAADYLRRTHFTELVVEVDYPVGYPPSASALALLEDRLVERCDKPGGITVFADDAIPLSEFPSVVDTDDLDDLSATYRDLYSDQGSQTAAMHVLYVKGASNLDGSGASTQVLGLTYHGGSIALFVDAADQGANPFVTTAEVEGTGLVHEAGHCLGLTGTTVPMLVDHRDDMHGFHDVDPDSVMYWIVTVPQVAPNIGDPSFAQFDPNSIDDLAAFGGLGAVPARVAAGMLVDPFERVPVGRCVHCERHARR